MSINVEAAALSAFQRAADRVPAYQVLLNEAGIRREEIRTLGDFARLPVLKKQNTFQRFPIDQLCVDGDLGRVGSVLTSSGHSGIFAFGVSSVETDAGSARWTDDLLDMVWSVRSQQTLLINCLPMGVKMHTKACALAETSVRPDMAAGLVKTFGMHFAQIILVGETAFIKLLLETGERAGVDWRAQRVSVIVGEETLAENARKYLENILGLNPRAPEKGLVVSSMGVAELGLNLFSEVPSSAPLIRFRRALHDDPELRRAVLGPADWVPSLFTYDPRRILVEFDDAGGLLLSMLDPESRIPLMRYSTGDRGSSLRITAQARPALEAAGFSCDEIEATPVVALYGRGDHGVAAEVPVHPEAVKEGIYWDAALARLTTANFRIVSGPIQARIRIQLSPGISPTKELERKFAKAIANYLRASFDVVCEPYESFGSGMTLDYERKFQYLGP